MLKYIAELSFTVIDSSSLISGGLPSDASPLSMNWDMRKNTSSVLNTDNDDNADLLDTSGDIMPM